MILKKLPIILFNTQVCKFQDFPRHFQCVGDSGIENQSFSSFDTELPVLSPRKFFQVSYLCSMASEVVVCPGGWHQLRGTINVRRSVCHTHYSTEIGRAQPSLLVVMITVQLPAFFLQCKNRVWIISFVTRVRSFLRSFVIRNTFLDVHCSHYLFLAVPWINFQKITM